MIFHKSIKQLSEPSNRPKITDKDKRSSILSLIDSIVSDPTSLIIYPNKVWNPVYRTDIYTKPHVKEPGDYKIRDIMKYQKITEKEMDEVLRIRSIKLHSKKVLERNQILLFLKNNYIKQIPYLIRIKIYLKMLDQK